MQILVFRQGLEEILDSCPDSLETTALLYCCALWTLTFYCHSSILFPLGGGSNFSNLMFSFKQNLSTLLFYTCQDVYNGQFLCLMLSLQLYFKATDPFNERWQSAWIITAFWDVLAFALLCVICYLWAPSQSSQRCSAVSIILLMMKMILKEKDTKEKNCLEKKSASWSNFWWSSWLFDGFFSFQNHLE